MPLMFDDPIVSSCERTGHPPRYTKTKYRCPDCGCEMYEGETVYSWTEHQPHGESEIYICGDCFDDKFSELTRNEMARLIGSEIKLL